MFIKGKRINVIPIWKKIGLNWGIEKFIITFNNKTILKEKRKIIVNDNHSSSLFFTNLSRNKLSVRYLNNNKNIEVIPRLAPVITSCTKPTKNKVVLDGFILNLTIDKYKIIEIIFGVAISKNGRKLNDFWKFSKKNNITKNNKLFENLCR